MLGGWSPSFVGGYPGAQTLYPTKLVSNLLLLMHRGIIYMYIYIYIYRHLYIYIHRDRFPFRIRRFPLIGTNKKGNQNTESCPSRTGQRGRNACSLVVVKELDKDPGTVAKQCMVERTRGNGNEPMEDDGR